MLGRYEDRIYEILSGEPATSNEAVKRGNRVALTRFQASTTPHSSSTDNSLDPLPLDVSIHADIDIVSNLNLKIIADDIFQSTRPEHLAQHTIAKYRRSTIT